MERLHGLVGLPHTPDHCAEVSKSVWTAKLSEWRTALHRFDPVVVAGAVQDCNGVYGLDSIQGDDWKYRKGETVLCRDGFSWRLFRKGAACYTTKACGDCLPSPDVFLILYALDPTPGVAACGSDDCIAFDAGHNSSSIVTRLTKLSSFSTPTTAHASEVSSRQTHWSADESGSPIPYSLGWSGELRVWHTFVNMAMEKPELRRRAVLSRAASRRTVQRRLVF